MRSINKVILIGNVTKDPVVKSTQAGKEVLTFTIATNRDWTNPSGERQSSAEFHSIAAWGSLADLCKRFVKKGKLVYVEGYLKTRYFESEDGAKTQRTEIVAYDLIMLSKREDFSHEEKPQSYSDDNDDNDVFTYEDTDARA